jgi:uncharacterized protein YndB with AHSA1/START domain
VYDEWLDPEALGEWMCPRPARATSIDLDPTIGGRLRIDIEEEGVEFAVTGRFVELDPPWRLSFTWSCSTWPDPSMESLVTVTLEPCGDNETRMTITHALLPPDLIDQHHSGWARLVGGSEAEMEEAALRAAVADRARRSYSARTSTSPSRSRRLAARSHSAWKRRTSSRRAAPTWSTSRANVPPASGLPSCSWSPTRSSLAPAASHSRATSSITWRDAIPASSKITRAPALMA